MEEERSVWDHVLDVLTMIALTSAVMLVCWGAYLLEEERMDGTALRDPTPHIDNRINDRDTFDRSDTDTGS